MSIPFLACMLAAAQFHHLPPRALPSIQAVEGGHVGEVSRNGNGTEDLGLMQVNTIWIAPVAQHTGLTQVVVRQRLIEDACFNIAVAAAILRIQLNETRGDLLQAVGHYHSHTPARSRVYQEKVLASARMLFNRR
jgi:soluble lytic murein transglycosylase-like protein